MPSVLIDNERVSSTRIRQALAVGDHALAAHLLGRPYTMMGRVVHGDKLGRQLGFPTANIYLHRPVTPVQGIYVVRMHGIDKQALPGVANVGIRPTIGGTRSLLEVYLFNFNRDIYGRQVCVEFCKKLRVEERYPNLDLLKEAIAQDAMQAEKYFRENGEL
jgi:riboflavin kinase/FMN adenylyltransferase